MALLATLLFGLVGLINIYPAIGVLGTQRLSVLYDITLSDPNLVLLLRHRALLFGIVGGVLVYAAFVPRYRPLATVVGLVSMLSFVALMVAGAGYNEALRRVFIADVVASIMLGTAFALWRITAQV